MRRVGSAARLLQCSVLALGLFYFIGSAAGQMAAMVSGTVTDKDGEPVEGARIVFHFEGGISREFAARSDKDGSYAQVGLQAGSYTVVAEKEGMGPKSAKVTLRLNDRLKVNFQFTPETLKSDLGVAKAFQDGVAASAAGRNDEAIARFREALTLNPKCYDCLYNMGLVYTKTKDYDRAVTAFETAAGVNPKAPDPFDGLAAVYNAQRKFDEAARAGQTAASLRGSGGGGGNATAVFDQGLILWNAGKIDEARAKFEETLQLDPNHGEVHYWLGMANLNQGKLPEAVQEMEMYLQREPGGRFANEAKGLLTQIKK